MTPICSTPQTLVAAFDLLVSLCRGCVQNLVVLADILADFYYSGNGKLFANPTIIVDKTLGKILA